jgi:hypothetical protein
MDSDSTMSQSERITKLRRRRGVLLGRLKHVDRQIDECEQDGDIDEGFITSCRQTVDELGSKINNIQDELDELEDPETERAETTQHELIRIRGRITKLVKHSQSATHPAPAKRDSETNSELITIKLPEIHLPTFDGTIEEWNSFHDTFISTIDRNEKLTPVQKYHYLRSSVTGKAARSLQSLDITESNYAIALNTLREKFDCHRRVCLRHWHLIRDYPKISKETPDAIEDLLETVQINLKALEKLGEPVASNVVLIDLITMKLPSSTVSKWHHTLPDKKMPSYRHLIEFLTARANGDQPSNKPKKIKESSYQRPRHQYDSSRGQTFTTTKRTGTCRICRGPHDIKNCQLFKAKPAKTRVALIKEASLCTNCLGKGHTITQCSAGSCRICRRRHHTLLHRDDIQVSGKVANSRSSCSRSPSDRSLSERSSSSRSPSDRSLSERSSSSRSSSDRSSSNHSSNGRSNKGRSPNGSPTPRSTHRSKRTIEPKRKSSHHHKTRSSRPNSIKSHGSAKEQRSKRK